MLDTLFPIVSKRCLGLPLFGRVMEDFTDWLGHASPNTTNKYATIDLEMKREAIAKVKPIRGQRRTVWRSRSVLDWLEGL